MVVAGDTNSYPQPTIDHLGGPSHIKQHCLANTLLSFGLRDAFRERHPTTRAFTFGESRLDQMFVKSATGIRLDTVNVAIIWDWPYRTDRTSIICDLLSTIPIITDKQNSLAHPAWRKLMRDATDPPTKSIIQEQIVQHISQHKERIKVAYEELAMVRLACTSAQGR